MSAVTALDRLAALAGIEADYVDGFGNRRAVGRAAKRSLLAALGFAVDDDAAIGRAAAALRGEQEPSALPPVLVRRQAELPERLVIVLPPQARRGTATWRLELEDGGSRSGRLQTGSGKAAIDLPADLPLGYHRLTVQRAGSCHLIVAPQRAWRPAALEGEGRLWGLSAQLYSLRSQRNWGVGDFGDLKRMVRGAADLAASVVGINPLHALFPERPEHVSPYSASSRLFRNPIYVDVEAVPDFRDSAAVRRLVGAAHVRRRLQALQNAPTVDYRGVSELKMDALALLHRAFEERRGGRPDDPRVADFRTFVEAGGESLRRFCSFHALAEHFQAAGCADWRAWPAAYRDPASPAVGQFAAEHEERVDFHAYLQWVTDRQLGECADVARRLGLPVGLYGDLAIGADPSGAEAWADQSGLAIGVQVGAPPDALNPFGQNWGFPPFDPRRLAASGYRPFVELLRANMRHVGALRIDHVIGLMRLYCIPEGAAATDGAFMRYPWRDLLAITALESVRHRCLVVGEDLGTVPEGLREAMNEHGILAYKLLFFEKAGNRLRPPEQYEREAVVQIGTHDLPTFAGYWQGADLRLRDRLNLWSSAAERREEWRTRVRDRRALRTAFSAPARPPPQRQAHDFLARTPSRLLLVQVEDVLGLVEQTNLPGTVSEHPNWCRRLPVDLETWLAGGELRRLAEAVLPSRGAPAWPAWAPELAGSAAAPPAVPAATYRIQFSAGTRFDDAARLVPYLARLGVSHLYASPWLQARAGSTHGYDITDHNAINPEIGDRDAFGHLSRRLAAYGIGHILDFVPNHMGIGKADNPWWLDVLEWGPQSPFAGHFDIDWVGDQRRLRGKVLLPMLGNPYGEVLEAGDLVPRFDAATGTYSVWYYEHRFPIRPQDYAGLIGAAAAERPDDATGHRLRRFASAFGRQAGRRQRARTLQQRLATVALSDGEASRRLARAAAALAGRAGRPRSFAALHRLLERQHFRLSHWRAAAHEINYRRFFDINELAGIRVERPEVFEAVHRLVGDLLASGRLHGLRIDHIDGLYDPKQYLNRLQRLRPPGHERLYVVVEKILARHERLREDWACAGSTGYEVLNQIAGVLVDAAGERPLSRAYRRFLGQESDFDATLREAKDLVTSSLLASELQVLARDLLRLSEQHWRTRDYTLEGLRQALAAMVVCFPVYRTYVDDDGADADDRRDIAWAVSQARRRWAGPGAEILDFVAGVLTTDIAAGERPDYPRDQVLRLAMRFQQYTGPVMAKSMEDTAFYRYHRLLALNEVGGDPRQFGLSPAAWHHAAAERARQHPHGMVTTATHDTKRGEDARARLAVLSEVPEAWTRRVRRWRTLNRAKRSAVDGIVAPGPNDEYLLYQSLLGAWPPGLGGTSQDAPGLRAFAGRIKGYMTKALREGKVSSTWTEPDVAYEAAVHAFVDGILDPASGRLFLADFLPFVASVARAGVLNSLSQVTLKLMSPGVPDIYQGTELWDFNLVDPDNRRPVDFARRAALLQRCDALLSMPPEQRCPALSGLLDAWHDGAIKLYVTLCLLRVRDAHRPLFRAGDYAAVECHGGAGAHALAFSRKHDGQRVLVAVARHVARLTDGQAMLPDPAMWGEGGVAVPAGWPAPATDALTGRQIAVSQETIPLAELFDRLPVAVLLFDE